MRNCSASQVHYNLHRVAMHYRELINYLDWGQDFQDAARDT